jgi:hypothetical protein
MYFVIIDLKVNIFYIIDVVYILNKKLLFLKNYRFILNNILHNVLFIGSISTL